MNTPLEKVTEILKGYGFKKTNTNKSSFVDDSYKSYIFTSKKYSGTIVTFWINDNNEYNVWFQYDGDNISNTSDDFDKRLLELEMLAKLFKRLKNLKKQEKPTRFKSKLYKKLIVKL